MFCNTCGSSITLDQSICPRCGCSTTGARAAIATRTRVAANIHLLAILWFVLGAFWLIPTTIMAILAAVITVPLVTERAGPVAIVFAPGMFVALCLLFLAFGSLKIATGWGLLKLRPWGRTFALVMAFFGLFAPPFGTALGVYTLYVLLPDAAADEYRRMCAEPAPRAALAPASGA